MYITAALPVAVQGLLDIVLLLFREGVISCDVLQILHQGPGTDEPLLKERDDGRTLQGPLPECPPGTSAGLVVEGPPEEDGVNQLPLHLGQVHGLQEGKIGNLEGGEGKEVRERWDDCGPRLSRVEESLLNLSLTPNQLGKDTSIPYIYLSYVLLIVNHKIPHC